MYFSAFTLAFLGFLIEISNGQRLTCFNGTSTENRFSDFVVTGCLACTKTVANYRLGNQIFSYYSWSGIGCAEQTANWTWSLSKPGDPSDCGIASSITNDNIRASLQNETFTCSALASLSGSVQSGGDRMAWKSSCICCTSRCNSQNFICNDNKTIENFNVPPSLNVGNETLVDMAKVKRSANGEDFVGLTCYAGTSFGDGSHPDEIVRNCSACTKHTVIYTFLGITSSYTIWGGQDCTKRSPLEQQSKPDTSSQCFVNVFGSRLTTNLIEWQVYEQMKLDDEASRLSNGSTSTSSNSMQQCSPNAVFSRTFEALKTPLGAGRIDTATCQCCTSLCNSFNWPCRSDYVDDDGNDIFNRSPSTNSTASN